MRDLALYLISNLVENPEAVTIEEEVDESGAIILSIAVAKEDMGRIIGKHGKIINALRNVVKIKALKENKLVNVILSE